MHVRVQNLGALATIHTVPGRRYNSIRKIWELPYSPDLETKLAAIPGIKVTRKTIKINQRAKSLPCRKRDLAIHIIATVSAYEVEVYIDGVYIVEESKTFFLQEHGTRERCKQLAIEFANAQTAKLL